MTAVGVAAFVVDDTTPVEMETEREIWKEREREQKTMLADDIECS